MAATMLTALRVFIACAVFFTLLLIAYDHGQQRCEHERAAHPSTTHVNGGC